MKQIVTIALLLAGFNSYATYYPGAVEFSNGKSREGFIDSNLGEVVLFKGWIDAPEPEEIPAAGIRTVWIKTNDGHKLNEYQRLSVDITPDKSTKRMWVKLLEKGTVSLFVNEIIMQRDGEDQAQPLYYYCLRNGEDQARLIATRSNAPFFIVKASKFFADNEKLVEKIKSKEYTWENVQKLVQDYNRSL